MPLPFWLWIAGYIWLAEGARLFAEDDSDRVSES